MNIIYSLIFKKTFKKRYRRFLKILLYLFFETESCDGVQVGVKLTASAF